MTEHQSASTLRVAVTVPLSRNDADYIRQSEPRIELLYEPDLLPPMRHPADFDGDPGFSRTAAQQARFDALVAAGEAFYGIPDLNPAVLKHAVATNRSLRWVHTSAAGGGGEVKQAGLSESELSRVIFTSSAGVHGETLAEWAVFGVLAGAKDLDRLLRQQSARTWSGRWTMRQLHEMTVLVVGLGGIGRRVAAKFAALGARVVAASRRELTAHVGEAEHVDQIIAPDRISDVVAEVDALVLALPGTSHTERLITRSVFDAARPGLIVVNVGRGTVIDEDDLLSAIEGGQVGYAALDVFATEPLPSTSPLWGEQKVLVSPHTAALSVHEDRRIAELFTDNATRLLDGRPLRNRIDTIEFY